MTEVQKRRERSGMESCAEQQIHSAEDSVSAVLGESNSGMRVHLHSLLASVRYELEGIVANRRKDGNPDNALLLTLEHLCQLEENLNELGERWYSGDALVTDEFLQLYCIAQDARAAVAQSVQRGRA